MKKHSTNYLNTLIQIAEDSKNVTGTEPPLKGEKKTIANIQFEILSKNPYKFTSDELLINVIAKRKDATDNELIEIKELFYSKGQPCLRCSPLTKSYGWGIHANQYGKIALLAASSETYENLINDSNIKKVTAMKSKR
jgi:hypothetical protein